VVVTAALVVVTAALVVVTAGAMAAATNFATLGSQRPLWFTGIDATQGRKVALNASGAALRG